MFHRATLRLSLNQSQRMPDEPDEFLTVDEVARLLKLNQQTVRNQIDRGEMPAVRMGPRRVRIRRSELARSSLRRAAQPRVRGPRLPRSTRAVSQRGRRSGPAMAETTAALETAERNEIVGALYGLANAVGALADALQGAGE
jgi:excisionase family DNA binding protein